MQTISGVPSVGPPFPKRPPPMPPMTKSLESKKPPDRKPNIPSEVAVNSPKPVPPPKPKFLFRQKSTEFADSVIPAIGESLNKNSGGMLCDYGNMSLTIKIFS